MSFHREHPRKDRLELIYFEKALQEQSVLPRPGADPRTSLQRQAQGQHQ